jgi:hypothetical protein
MQGCGPRGRTKSHIICFQECKECEGMKPHTPKWTPIVGVGVPNVLSNLHSAITGVITHWLEELFISLESYWNVGVQNGLALPIWTSETKLWSKERSGVKLAIWFPTIKSQELTRFLHVQAVWDIILESSWREIQLCFKPHCNRRSTRKIMGPQSRGSPNYGNFGTPTWESRDKKPFGCGPRGEVQSIL